MKTLLLTDDEFDFLKEVYPDLDKQIINPVSDKKENPLCFPT